MSLFRKEAVTEQSTRLTGAIILSQPLSIKITVTILIAIASLIVVFLFSAEYSRKETVRGFLIPNKGIINSVAKQGGTVDKIWISQGEQVEKGQVLVSVVVTQSDMEGAETSTRLIQQLNKQVELFDDEIIQHQNLLEQEIRNFKSNKKALHNEKLTLETQLSLANQSFELRQTQQYNINRLSQSGFVSKLDKEQQTQSLISAQQEIQNVSRLLLQQQKELDLVEFNLIKTPQQYDLQINNIKRQKLEVERQLEQVINNHKYTVIASHSGMVTGIQIVEGQAIQAQKLLLKILPKGSELVAELLLPTRSVGFVKQGQQARLRFDAFPYQRFGFIQSNITRIDKALISPNEAQLPIQLNEPMYRLRAKLTQQQMKAYGKELALISGMLFEADIMLEQRTLIEWLLEPIYSLKGRIS